ncbi:MAG: hypothetical protein JRC92_10335 [Deltaproteobacteria bacterium]|nr:hypothetical protein [Deltaproteobacteria bacterium]
MDQKSEMEAGTTGNVSEAVSRDIFRQVVRQRQALKRDLRRLKEELAQLPPDWPERLSRWLDLENRAEELEKGRWVEAESLEAAKADWEDRERTYQHRIAELFLDQRIRQAAANLAAYDPDDVVGLTRELFEVGFEEGKPRVALSPRLDEVGLERYRVAESEGTERIESSLEEVVSQFLKQKPHLIRARTFPGSGSQPRVTQPTTPTPHQGLYDPAEQARAILAQRLVIQGRSG